MSGATLGTKVKDPDAELEYTIDWEDFLDGKAITASVWTSTAGSIRNESATSTTTSAVIVGGGNNTEVSVQNRITFGTLDEVDDRTFKLTINQK